MQKNEKVGWTHGLPSVEGLLPSMATSCYYALNEWNAIEMVYLYSQIVVMNEMEHL